MRRLILIATSLLLVGCSRINTGPLAVQTPADWKVDHKPLGGSDFYTVTGKNPGDGLLMFSKWPVSSSPDDIPALVKTLADGFLETAKKDANIKLTSESYSVESFGGDHCKGSYAAFRSGVAGNNVAAMFMMQVNGAIWNGQFTGSKEDWAKSLELLSTLKGRGW